MKRSPPSTCLNNLQSHSSDDGMYFIYINFITDHNFMYYYLESMSKLDSLESFQNTFNVVIPRPIPTGYYVRNRLTLNVGINGHPICLNSFNSNILFAESKKYNESKSDLVPYYNNNLEPLSPKVPLEDISYLSPTSKRNKLRTSFDDGTYTRIYNEYNISESLNKLVINDALSKTRSKDFVTGASKVPFDIKNMTIVIADDALVDRKFLTKIVNKHKGESEIDICTAQNGFECTELCQKILDDKNYNVENVVLIFMDINMPNKNGFEATREIRNFSNGFTPYIVGMSSHDTPEYRSTSLESGMNSFVSKPFTVKKVQSLFSEIDFLGNNSNSNIFSPEFNSDSKCLPEILI